MVSRDVVVAFQGEHGAYSEAAARILMANGLGDSLFGIQYLGLPQFSDVFAAVQNGSAMYAAVPVENTLGGSIHANYDLLLKYPGIHVIGELDFPVRHCLIAPAGATRSSIRRVMSHWQALAQCDGYLRAWGVEQQPEYDTAGSAKMIKELGLRDTAAICSELAAATYGLEVLAKGIQDVQFNHTRFLLLSREHCMVVPEPLSPKLPSSKKAHGYSVKTTVIFRLPHTPGALFRAVSAFALRGLHVVKTESRPVPPKLWKELQGTRTGESAEENAGKQGKYRYVFYLDIAAHAESEEMRNALDHLREISEFVRVLGPYPTGGQLTSDVILKTRAVMPPPVNAASAVSKSAGALRIGIVGFGKFGQFLAHRLAEQHQVFVTSVEPELEGTAGEMGCTWVPWQDFGQEMLVTHEVDTLVLAVSMTSFSRVLGLLPAAELKQKRPLIVDVLSVKSYAKEVMLQQLPQECDVLCTHPMFGPESGKAGWNGLPFVFEVIRTTRWERTQKFLGIFEGAGCRMVSLSCEEHDRQTAASQFLTHLTGRVLATHGCDRTPIDTVGYQNLCLIADHVCKDSFDLFYGLFRFNPNALEQLMAYKRGMEGVEKELRQRATEDAAKNPSAGHGTLSALVGKIMEPKMAKVQALSRKLQEEGVKVNSVLSVGALASPPAVVAAAVGAFAQEASRDCEAELQEAIRDDLRARRGVEYKPEEILVCRGAEEATYQALLAVCMAGDEVLVPTPCRAGLFDTVRLCRATPVPLPTRVEDGHSLQPGALLAALEGSRCRVVVLCNPSVPSGAVIPLACLAALAEILQRPEFEHIFVLADETYARLCHSAESSNACVAALPKMKQRTILVSGLSEAYAMPNLRVGFLATAHESVAVAATKIRGTVSSGASVVAQRAALAVLKGGAAVEDWTNAQARELREKRDLVLARLGKLPGVRCSTPEAALFVLVDLSEILNKEYAEVKTAEDFCLRLLREHQVEAHPGDAFQAPSAVRLSFAGAKDQLQAALNLFQACVTSIS